MKVFLYTLLVIIYAGLFISTVFFLVSHIFKKAKLRAWGWRVYGISCTSLGTYIISRWIASRHPPVQGNFENAILGAFFLLLIHIFSARRVDVLKTAAWTVSGFILLMLGWGLFNGSVEVVPLEPAFKSNWLWFHVGFAWLAFGAFTISAVLGGMYIAKRKEPGDALETSLVRFVALGFVAQGLMILTGSIWAYYLWGSYWSWDPVETWSLICWLIYGLYLHMRYVMGWKGRRIAWLTIISFVAMLITFFGVSALSQYHTELL